MSTKSLVVITFGDNRIHFYRHWGGDPEVVGRQVLDQLQSAKTIKPRSHFHSGSWLVRLMMSDGDEGETSLPTYEIECLPEGYSGDWDYAYIFKGLPDPEPENGLFTDVGNRWSIGFIEHPYEVGHADLDSVARWYSEEEWRQFVDAALEKGLREGKTYDFHVRDAFLKRMPPGSQL